MTPAQKVALDAMRSAWPEEVVQRMLRAEKPDIETALIETDDYWASRPGRTKTMAGHSLGWSDVREMVLQAARTIRRPFSPPETATGAHAHRPKAPAGETEFCCIEARDGALCMCEPYPPDATPQPPGETG